MAFTITQPVEFKSDMQFGSQKVPAGTRAFISQLTTKSGPVWVSVPSIRREVIVPQSVLRPVHASIEPMLTGASAAPIPNACRFAQNAPVTLAVDRQYGNDLVTAGTRGQVTQVIPLAVACVYWVRWSSLSRDVMVPESDLI